MASVSRGVVMNACVEEIPMRLGDSLNRIRNGDENLAHGAAKLCFIWRRAVLGDIEAMAGDSDAQHQSGPGRVKRWRIPQR
ncbi:MAG: hypothetical protein KBD56_00905 [Candidatus Eisenbacteria bacterium]|nr:hypothetical protein [Candidatus Eisenbacteria bacterium]